jgi:UDP-GlcNAc3NAcA epimerase
MADQSVVILTCTSRRVADRSTASHERFERDTQVQIVTVVGARPQFIKAATVSRELRAKSGVEEVLVHTGQHYDENMSDVFFEELEIPHPDHHLGIGSGSHGTQTGRMLEAAERVLLAAEPDLVLVYGDTNSTLAGALAAVKLHIPVAHVEAGLRSSNRRMPEEINRVLTDHASDLLFTPTETATENLRREGISAESIYWVGDVMYDAALFYADKAKEKEEILKRLQLEPKGYVLATVHRAENTDDLGRLRAIFEGLERVADSSPVIMPLHPRAKKKLSRLGLRNSKIRYLDPVGYLDMISLEKNAAVIATDSGGVQKEAFFYRVPCVTLRE